MRRADFETGDLGQWDTVERVSRDRIRVVQSPVRQGAFAGRFEVRPGDRPVDANERAEVRMQSGEREGMERLYRWSSMVAPGFPPSAWSLIAQWHATADGPPPLALYVDGPNLVLTANRRSSDGRRLGAVDLWSAPLAAGSWHDFQFRIRWSGSDSVGFVEVAHNGVRQRLDNGQFRRSVRTMIPGDPENYLKQGYYRAAGTQGIGIVYHDGFIMEAVNP